MSFIYGRTVAITRPAAETAAGLNTYAGLKIATETAVIGAITYSNANTFVSLVGIPANIGDDDSDRGGGPMYPASARRMEYRITLRLSDAAIGAIREQDFVTDDIGKRYQVSAATYTSLGYQLRASLLEN